MNCSFIVIAHKSSGTLERCLSSIEDISENGDELILVLNNPDAKTASIADKFPNFKVIWENNPGPAFARNAGARMATRPILCFFDSDVGVFTEFKQILETKFSNPWIVAGQFQIRPERDSTLLTALKRINYLALSSYGEIFLEISYC